MLGLWLCQYNAVSRNLYPFSVVNYDYLSQSGLMGLNEKMCECLSAPQFWAFRPFPRLRELLSSSTAPCFLPLPAPVSKWHLLYKESEVRDGVLTPGLREQPAAEHDAPDTLS